MIYRTMTLHYRRYGVGKSIDILSNTQNPCTLLKININTHSGLSLSACGKWLFRITNKGTFIRRKSIRIDVLRQNSKGQVRELQCSM